MAWGRGRGAEGTDGFRQVFPSDVFSFEDVEKKVELKSPKLHTPR